MYDCHAGREYLLIIITIIIVVSFVMFATLFFLTVISSALRAFGPVILIVIVGFLLLGLFGIFVIIIGGRVVVLWQVTIVVKTAFSARGIC